MSGTLVDPFAVEFIRIGITGKPWAWDVPGANGEAAEALLIRINARLAANGLAGITGNMLQRELPFVTFAGPAPMDSLPLNVASSDLSFLVRCIAVLQERTTTDIIDATVQKVSQSLHFVSSPCSSCCSARSCMSLIVVVIPPHSVPLSATRWARKWHHVLLHMEHSSTRCYRA